MSSVSYTSCQQTYAVSCRVEPKGASHVFIVHGSECRKTPGHDACTFDPRQSLARKGMMYVIDIEEAVSTDWKVSQSVLLWSRMSFLEESSALGRPVVW